MQQTALTEQELADNEAACEVLVPGKHYRFDPPVEATATPLANPEVREVRKFSRGWYLAFRKQKHVFQGKPIKRYKGERVWESYFHVDFVGGSKLIPED